MPIWSETPSSPCRQNNVRLASNEKKLNQHDRPSHHGGYQKNKSELVAVIAYVHTSPTGHLDALSLLTNNNSTNFVERLNDSLNYTRGSEPYEDQIIENGDEEVSSTVQFSTDPTGGRTTIPLPKQEKNVN